MNLNQLKIKLINIIFFFHTALEPFKSECILENILRRLLNQDIYRHIKNKSKEKNDPSTFIFQQGKHVDYFVMILEGRVEVTVGKENLIFEGGPFTHFGIQALIQNIGIDSPVQQVQNQVLGSLQSLNMDAMLRHTFIPDYSVRALTDVVYLVIKRSLYMTAKRATLMEQAKRLGGDHSNDPIDDEVEKVNLLLLFIFFSILFRKNQFTFSIIFFFTNFIITFDSTASLLT